MRKIAIVLALCALALVGCKGLKDKILGTWKVDPTSITGVPKDQAAELAKTYAPIRYKFEKGGGFEISGASGVQYTGKWDTEDTKLKLTFDSSDANFDLQATMNADISKIHVKTLPSNVEFDLVHE